MVSSKKTNTKKEARAIDKSISTIFEKIKKKFVIIRKKEVKVWQGALILMFFMGAVAALIFSVQSGIQTNSSASIAVGSELGKIQKAIKDKKAGWVAGDNPIFRLSAEEKKKRITKSAIPTQEQVSQKVLPATEAGSGLSIPSSLDWRNQGGKNYITPIKNQDSCGSCWAFASTAGLESYNLKNNAAANLSGTRAGTRLSATGQTIPDDSEQVLISCSSEVGLGSCAGGSFPDAANFLQDRGLPAESCYPYIATNGDCASACSGWQQKATKIGSWGYINGAVCPPVDETKKALLTYGPLVTGMKIYDDFWSYNGGIYKHVSGAYEGDHVVLLVGYNDTEKYFIAKNSWGTGWGEQGFFRIAYGNMTDFGCGSIAYSKTIVKENSLTIIYPNGGESLAAGSTHDISWKYTGFPGQQVQILLLKNGVFDSQISYGEALGADGKGKYSWTVPNYQSPGTDYQIKIFVNGNANYFDSSDSKFSIKAPPDPSQCIQTGKVSNNASLGPNGNFGVCCPGLAEIDGGQRYDASTGSCRSLEGAGMVCSACGNRKCETWENPCNCPTDCP